MVNGKIGLRVPRSVITATCAPYLRRGTPAHRSQLVNRDDHHIVGTYGAEYRGIVQYYLPADDVYRMRQLERVTKTSMLKTLAAKHQSTVSKMTDRHNTVIQTPHGLRTRFEVRVEHADRKPLVARFGGIPVKRQKNAALNDRVPDQITYPRQELIVRFLKGRCEICEQKDDVRVHHVRKLADLGQPSPDQPVWVRLTAKKRRKTLAVYGDCHEKTHAGKKTATPTE